MVARLLHPNHQPVPVLDAIFLGLGSCLSHPAILLEVRENHILIEQFDFLLGRRANNPAGLGSCGRMQISPGFRGLANPGCGTNNRLC